MKSAASLMLAAFGSTVLTAAAPSADLKHNGPREERQPTGKSEIVQATRQVNLPPVSAEAPIQTTEQAKPCRKNEERRDSELCANWHAADEAKRAADYALFALWLSVVGVIGLAITLWFNFQAWRQARSSESDTIKALAAAERSAESAARHAAVAEDTAKRQLRGYLGLVRVKCQVIEQGDGPRCRLIVEAKNTGQTPVTMSEIGFSVRWWSVPASELRLLSSQTYDMQVVYARDESMDIPLDGGAIGDSLAWDEEGAMILHISLKYIDIFGDDHETRGSYNTPEEDAGSIENGVWMYARRSDHQAT